MFALRYQLVRSYRTAICCSFMSVLLFLLCMNVSAMVTTRNMDKRNEAPILAEVSKVNFKKKSLNKKFIKRNYSHKFKLNKIEIDLTKSVMQWLHLQDDVINTVTDSQMVEAMPNRALKLVDYINQKMIGEGMEPLSLDDTQREKYLFLATQLEVLANVVPRCSGRVNKTIIGRDFFKSIVMIILLQMEVDEDVDEDEGLDAGDNKFLDRLTELYDDDSLAPKNKRYLAYLKSLITQQYVKIDDEGLQGIRCFDVYSNMNITFFCRDKDDEICLDRKSGKKIIIKKRKNKDDYINYYSVMINGSQKLLKSREPVFTIEKYSKSLKDSDKECNNTLLNYKSSKQIIEDSSNMLTANSPDVESSLGVDQSEAGLSKADQDEAAQSEAGLSKADLDEAGQDEVGQSKAGQSEAGQNETGQNEAGQSEAGIVPEVGAKKSAFSMKKIAFKGGRFLKAVIPNTRKKFLTASLVFGVGAALYASGHGATLFTYASKKLN